jgi:hypothetical protein
MSASIDNLINVNFTKGRNDLLKFGLMLGGKGQHRPYVFTPADLFFLGEQGAYYTPGDISTLFQDAAGTTPVTADGDPVGLMLDQSGNGNHATQSTSAARPIYRTDGTLHWLEFDGVDDVLFSVGSRIINAFTIAAAHRETSRQKSTLYGFGTSTSNRLLGHLPFSSGNYFFDVKSSGVGRITGTWPLSVNDDAVISHYRDASNTAFGRINGASAGTVSVSQAVTSNGFALGRSGFTGDDSAFYAGRIYGFAVIFADKSSNVPELENYMSSLNGVTL